MLRRLLAAALACLLPSVAMAQADGERIDAILGRLDDIQAQLGSRGAGVLGIMGYNVTPDGSANSLQVSRGNARTELGSQVLTLSQLGAGFTVSESFPLWLEGYLGYARYDPRAVFTNLGPRRTPLRWNNLAATIGVGYDIQLGDYLWLRPIFNLSGGYAAGDSSLFGSLVNYATGRDIAALTDRHVNVWGIGGSLMLAYYDHRPARDIDVELRYTQIYLQTFGDTFRPARGTSMAKTLGLWARYRWPTGWEAFGRPVRWVLDGSFTSYLGDQEQVLGFSWSAKVGGGIEIDVGRYEFGAMGLNVSRIRFIGRYFIGDNEVTGASFGIGVSF
ncbi:hypothetical protein GXW78_17305 [Roseomonas terrae]|uniref:Autotransporter domain-containing protein n=1 Tax=Neoroseomonas terrae TaxID=424799 RepID=A0ABS5EK76_9PROT|nr:hypothetical protein [Neoroseomonas terrae]MBR0651431.1 hypothetical protein [Neoroseomonas terrae]